MKARDVFGAAFGRSKLLLALGVVVALVLPAAALGDTLPTVSGEEASEVGVTTVKLSGQVNPNGTSGDGNTTWRLQWSPAGTDHGAEGEENWNTANEGAIEPPASEEGNPVGVEAMIGFGGELQPGQEYEFRLQAENGAGQGETAASYPTFTMDAANPPVLAAEAASEVSVASAHLKGTVDPEGGNVNPIDPEALPIHWDLQYSADGSSWNTAGSGDITGAEAEGTAPIAVEADAIGLVAATEYQVRLHGYTNNPSFSFFLEVDSPGPNPTFTTDPAVTPVLALDPPGAVTADSAHISGTVDPEGGNEDAQAGVLPIAWELQVNKDEEGWNTVGSGELTGADAESEDPVAVEADANNLVPNSHYRYRLVVHYAGLQKETPENELGEFETEAIGPGIERETNWALTATSIQLNSLVNPHNAALTDCHFEYGANGVLDQTAPCEAHAPGQPFVAPTGEGFAGVSARLSGLEPATGYEFRLVATNSAGTAEGDPRTFTTPEEAAPRTCPEEATREAQHSTHLHDCRHWEKVSPAEKGNGDIVGDGVTTIASRQGDAVVFNSRTPFGDTIGSGVSGQTQYLARRSPVGWDIHSITPKGRPDAYQTFFAPTHVQVFSDDLRNAVVWGYDLPEASGDVPLRKNIYVEDTASRALETVTREFNGLTLFNEFFEIADWGTSADARHVAFVSVARFLPEAAPGVRNVYRWDDGVLSLAGVLPDGSVPSTGSDVRLGVSDVKKNYRGAMSADGTRLLFMATPDNPPLVNRQLYMRVGDEKTVWVSEPEIPSGEPGYDPDPSGLVPQAMTGDGRNVFFTTASPLLSEDTNGDFDLYRYTESADPSIDDNLTMITEHGGMETIDVVGVSEDGQRVYYHTLGNDLSVWDHGENHLVASNIGYVPDDPKNRLGLTGAVPGAGRVTEDGAYLAFYTEYNPYQAAFAPGESTNGKTEMYLYSLADDTLRCVSCPARIATTNATVKPAATEGLPNINNIGARPRFLSERGQVFFSTAEALVTSDTNGVLDTYEYDPATGTVDLLSMGKGSDPATFADASASGDDVFLVTRQRLVGSDDDDLVDLYDVRSGDALPEATPLPSTPCSGEECQGAASPPPGQAPVVSAADGRGNLQQVRRASCGKKHRAVRRQGKARCGKKHHKQKKREANNDRRTGR